MKKTYLLILFTLLFKHYLTAQSQLTDSTETHPKFSIRAGAHSGLSYLLGQPEKSYFAVGSTYGFVIEGSLHFNKKIAVTIGSRINKSENTIKFRTAADPDFFAMNTSTFQIPVFVNYNFYNKRNNQILGVNIGAAYNWNNYKVIYNETIYTRPSTATYREVEVNTSDNDLSVILGVYKNIKLNKNGKLHMRLFNEYQFNFYTSSFLDKIFNPTNTIIVENDNFLPVFIRTGFYINLML
ncbi:MAG: hypothetical protein KBE91_10820 [Bacteroidia bacterium]|nr:hypothetical protein [Bacteroidia bacterium]